MRYAERLASAGAVVAIAAGASSADNHDPHSPETRVDNSFVQTLESTDPLIDHSLPDGVYIAAMPIENKPTENAVSDETEVAVAAAESTQTPEVVTATPTPTNTPEALTVEPTEVTPVATEKPQEVKTPTPEPTITVTVEPTAPAVLHEVTVPGVSSDGEVKENEQGPVGFESVLERLNGGPTKSDLFVVNSQEDLNEVYSQFNYWYGESEVPEIDFTDKSVLVMFGGYRFTQYEMTYINSIQDLGDRLEVEVVDIQPDFNNGVCQYEKNPSASYQVVVLDEKVDDLTPIERKIIVDNNCYELVETENGVEKTLIEQEVESPLEFSSILKSINGGLTKKENMVIDSVEDWKIATQDLHNGYGSPEQVEIDFDNEYAVAVFRGFDFTQEVDIEIVSVIDRGDHVEVNVVDTSPDFTTNPDAYEKNPSAAYHIVRIPGKYDEQKPVIFNEVQKVIEQ